MTKLTKAQLVAENEALRSQLDTQHHINRQHVADIAVARALIAAAQPSPNLIHTNDLIDADDIRALHAKPVYVMPAWQLERKAAMESAKATALQTRSYVVVQS